MQKVFQRDKISTFEFRKLQNNKYYNLFDILGKIVNLGKDLFNIQLTSENKKINN